MDKLTNVINYLQHNDQIGGFNVKRKSLVELKELIIKDLEYQNDNIKTFQGNENTQIKDMYNKSIIRAEALKDVLDYINTGSKFQFYKMEE